MHVFLHVHVHVHVCMWTYMCIHDVKSVYMFMSMFVCGRIRVYMMLKVCTSVCVYVCMYVCM